MSIHPQTLLNRVGETSQAWEGHVTCVQVATSGVFEWEAWEVTLLAFGVFE
jgi:hypothetical protein